MEQSTLPKDLVDQLKQIYKYRKFLVESDRPDALYALQFSDYKIKVFQNLLPVTTYTAFQTAQENNYSLLHRELSQVFPIIDKEEFAKQIKDEQLNILILNSYIGLNHIIEGFIKCASNYNTALNDLISDGISDFLDMGISKEKIDSNFFPSIKSRSVHYIKLDLTNRKATPTINKIRLIANAVKHNDSYPIINSNKLGENIFEYLPSLDKESIIKIPIEQLLKDSFFTLLYFEIFISIITLDLCMYLKILCTIFKTDSLFKEIRDQASFIFSKNHIRFLMTCKPFLMDPKPEYQKIIYDWVVTTGEKILNQSFQLNKSDRVTT